MIWFSVIILILFTACLAVASRCEHAFFHPVPYSREHEFDVIPKNWDYDIESVYESLSFEDIRVRVPNGYELAVSIIPPEKEDAFADGRKRAVIIAHGITANRFTMLAHAEIWHRLGAWVIIYDERAHGDSGGDSCGMGYYESRDLIFLAGEMRKRFPEDTVWGIGGESMGAATVMMAAKDIPWLSFAYEDGGYSSLREEIPASLKYKAKLPRFPFTPLTIMFINLRHEFKVDDIRPIDAVRETDIPMLFLHGGLDMFVPTENVYRLCEAKKDKKEIHVFEDAPHVKAAFMRHEEYFAVIRDFCVKYDII